MPELTFGEQVKIVLKRRGMTIKELAERIEEDTGKKMSRQNLTQRLSRDNFQEQDMRMIAAILGCPLVLSILEDGTSGVQPAREAAGEIHAEQYAKRTLEEERHTGSAPDRERQSAGGAPDRERQSAGGVPDEWQSAQRALAGRAAAGRDRAGWKDTVYELYDVEELYAEEEPYDEEPEELGEQSGPDGLSASERQLELSDEEPLVDYKGDYTVEELLAEVEAIEAESSKKRRTFAKEKEEKPHGWRSYLRKAMKNEKTEPPDADMPDTEPPDTEFSDTDYEPEEELFITENSSGTEERELSAARASDEERRAGNVNPYTGREYQTNSVRVHPDRIGYVQVYDREEHRWTDMTEWAFLGYQERKKALLGNDYEPPIYLD